MALPPPRKHLAIAVMALALLALSWTGAIPLQSGQASAGNAWSIHYDIQADDIWETAFTVPSGASFLLTDAYVNPLAQNEWSGSSSIVAVFKTFGVLRSNGEFVPLPAPDLNKILLRSGFVMNAGDSLQVKVQGSINFSSVGTRVVVCGRVR